MLRWTVNNCIFSISGSSNARRDNSDFFEIKAIIKGFSGNSKLISMNLKILGSYLLVVSLILFFL
jgi:hypothetical protein